MIPVFTDASSAILLEKIELFESFSKAFFMVMAPSVFDEITKPGYPGAESFKKAEKKGWFTIRSPKKDKHLHTAYPPETLGEGEKDTLYLFLESPHGFIVTDDGKAARWCDRYHLPFTNALLIPKILWYSGLMKKKECVYKMKALCKIGRYSEKVKTVAFGCTSENLSFIFPEKSNEK